MTRSAAFVVGPVTAGLLLVTVGPGWAIAVDAATFAASVLFLALLQAPPRQPAERSSFVADLREGWTEFAARRWVWSVVLASCLINALYSIYLVLGPLVSARELGGPGPWAAVVSASGLGSVVGGAVALRLKPDRPLLVASIAGVPFSFAPLGMAAGAPVPVVVAGSFLGGVGVLVFLALYETSLQRHVPPPVLGRVASYDWFGSIAAQPLGFALAAPLAGLMGAHAALWVAAVGVFVLLSGIILVPDVRRLPAVPDVPDSVHPSGAGSVRDS